MRRILSLTAALLVTLCIVGCKTVTAPLPAWAPNAQVAIAGQAIDSAYSTITGYEKDQADCAAQPTLTKCPGVSNPAIHAAVQKMQQAYAIAQPEFKQWQAAIQANPNAVEPANLSAAVSTIQTVLSQWSTLAK